MSQKHLSLVLPALLALAGCGPANPMMGAGGGGGTGGGGGGGGGSQRTEALTLGGSVSPNVKRVALLGVSGASTWVDVQNGAFTAPIPSEPFSVIFYGERNVVLSNLTAKQGTRSVAIFPAPRSKTTQPLTGTPTRGQSQQPLLTGTAISLGTITVTVTLTVEAQYDFFDDVDTDGDGTVDSQDADDDGDGTPDTLEVAPACDPDGDGILSVLDPDDDNDGTPDAMDNDDDGDGVPDLMDGDEDGDGIGDAFDLDDDGDGILDTAEAPDATPDLLVGVWQGTTEVSDFSFASGRAVPMDETFTLTADGTMHGDFHAVDATSGCDVTYALDGTWADALDAAHVLEVEWTSITLQISQCTDTSFDTNGAEDVTAAEKDLWDDELDGYWFLEANRLVIVSPQGAVIADYDRAP
jgi:hypothetical protein